VRAVPLAPDARSEFVDAVAEHAYTGEYPLARFLFLYINHAPGTALDPLRSEFVRYVFSRDGQKDVVKDGYLPVPNAVAAEALRTLGVTRADA
jgi:phosphate transport system substrate-binding protein